MIRSAAAQVHGGTPVFVIEDGAPPPAAPQFTCYLTIPALSSPHGGYEQKSFTAVARAKKAAEHAAAEMALEYIAASGLMTPAMPALSPFLGSSITKEEVRGASRWPLLLFRAKKCHMNGAIDCASSVILYVHVRIASDAFTEIHRDTAVGDEVVANGKPASVCPPHSQ